MYLTQSLHRSVQNDPDGPATVSGDRVRTWADSAARVARFAAGLRVVGVCPGDRVGILALNSDLFHEFLYAVPWADAVVNPVNTRWSTAEIAFSLRDSETRVLVVDEAFAELIPRLRSEKTGLHTVIYAGTAPAPTGTVGLEELITQCAPIPDARRGGDSLAGVFYTGGTTGEPKGVMLSHNNLLTSALGAATSAPYIHPGGRSLHAAPMFHLACHSAWVTRNNIGGTHVFVPRFAPGSIAATIEKHRVTDVLLVPRMLRLLLDAPETADADLSSLGMLAYGDSPLSEALFQLARARLPGAEFLQAYGTTELGPVATLLSQADHRVPRLRRSAGRAAAHCELRVVDGDDRPVPSGVVGEIVCRGGHVMQGYWNRPEETEAALRNGWLHTGDGGYLDEHGYLHIVDRIRDVIVSAGEAIYPAEVENTLANHPAVSRCAVIGLPDDSWGESVHAVVVIKKGMAAPTGEQLREHVKAQIAAYKAPRTVEFVDALPLSTTGQVLKAELRASRLT